jgi:phage-related protein
MTRPSESRLTVRFFATLQGAEPVREWLLEPDRADRRAIGADIKTVQFGWPLGMPLVRKLEAGLWEVRVDVKDGIARILFTVEGAAMVLLHAFVKKSRKTPTSDLDLARRRKRELDNG